MSDGRCLSHSQSERAERARDMKRCKSSSRRELRIFKKLVRGTEGKLRKKAEDKIRELEERIALESGKKKRFTLL